VDAVELLQFLRRKYKKDSYRRLCGDLQRRRYVEPPPLQTSMNLFLAPLMLSAVPVFLVKNMWLQWAAASR
jgi:hypothetical protein